MNQHEKIKTVGTREFLRDFNTIANRPPSERYTILRHGKPVGVFIPHRDRARKGSAAHKKHITFHDLENVRFKTKEKDISKNIDRIVYGISR